MEKNTSKNWNIQEDKKVECPCFHLGAPNAYRTTSVFQVPLTEEEEELEVKNTIQQTVSHFTSNTNKVTL